MTHRRTSNWRLPSSFREPFAIGRSAMRLALFEPDIPQNTGTLIRLGACLGVPVDIIEPTGFPWSDKALKRAGLDYWELADVIRHASWETYLASRAAPAPASTPVHATDRPAAPPP